MRPALVIAALAAAGCADLPSPAELARPQILAVRADPPALADGGAAELAILVAGPDGTIDDAEIDWAVTSPAPDIPALGEIEIDGDGRVWYVPPPDLDGPALTSVEASVRVDGSPTLLALKGIGVGLNRATANPTIEQLLVAGEPVAEGATVAIGRGELASLDARVSPPPDENALFSWHANLGEIDLYRRAPTELLAPDEPGEGTLYLVYRDGRGGVAWRAVALVVE